MQTGVWKVLFLGILMSSSALTSLDSYRLLGRSGLRVSPLCLGAMTFGTEAGIGSDKVESRRVFDHYRDRGGNFIDTANYYNFGTSEEFLGEFLEGCREQMVVGTKYTLSMREGDPNAGGNHRKNLVHSLEASLRRLKTDCIDLYWVHMWEGRTPVDEVMRALDDCVRAGKIFYVGISDVAAWKVAEANTLALLRGWSPFIALQIKYNLLERDVERDLLPMANEFALGVTPWAPLAAGVLTGKYNQAKAGTVNLDDVSKRQVSEARRSERNLRITEDVISIAEEIGRTPAEVALNWLLQKPGVCSPILGARTLEHLEANLRSLEFCLSEEHMERLDLQSRIELGFPHDFNDSDMVRERIAGNTQIIERFS